MASFAAHGSTIVGDFDSLRTLPSHDKLDVTIEDLKESKHLVDRLAVSPEYASDAGKERVLGRRGWPGWWRLAPEVGELLRQALAAARERLYQRRRREATANSSTDASTEAPTLAQQQADDMPRVMFSQRVEL